MRICLAALEGNCDFLFDKMPDNYLKYCLISFQYLKDQKQLEKILSKVQYILVDSGAHSFQHGLKTDFDKYTDEYVDFIKRNTDNPQIMGFFEMDVDNVIGYDKVLQLRKRLDVVSDKIIPVWHNNRGIPDFIEMCKQHSGRRIAITGFRNKDIKDAQYNLFINTAHKYGCDIHILGLTRFELIQGLNLNKNDSVDSSSWKQNGIYGGISAIDNQNKIVRFSFAEGLKIHWEKLAKQNFIIYKYIQDIYDKGEERISKDAKH